MSMPSNRTLFSLVSAIPAMLLTEPPQMRYAPSGSKGTASRGKNRAHQRKGYNRVKK